VYKISQRRYLGNKNSILPFIENIIKNEIVTFGSLCDIFAGTGTVGDYFNSIKVQKDNYFSINFGNKYFEHNIAKKIGFIREQIRKLFLNKQINRKEKNILLTSLNYSIDKIANTVGHYDAFIKKDIPKQKFKMKMLDIDIEKNQNNEIYNQDANTLIRDIECDILYLDPPYNSRQYCDAYHLLENLTLWQKPEVFGVAKKFDRTKIKSEYSKSNASNEFNLKDIYTYCWVNI
jgi:adenine-specific DNA methylase